MFYSVFVLGKKGPLARVWLAAHWDKKITKAQILETNIVESVDSILQPRVKLSLRTSSHLLLGIVRIYARKTLYLLQDCQDAAFKIKSAFRPGAVDLPDGKTEAAISAITLPEMLDFIDDFDLVAEPPAQIEHPMTNANIRSITLVEDMSSVHVDDPLLQEVRDWGDISSVRGPSGDDHTLQESNRSGTSGAREHPLDIFDRPIDDGFGALGGDGDVDDMFALPVPPEAQEQMEAEQREREARAAAAMGVDRPLSRMSERSDDYSAPPSMAPSGPPSTPGSVPPPPDMDDNDNDIFSAGPGRSEEQNQQPQMDADGNIIPPRRQSDAGAVDSMVLEPLEGPGLERKRKRRKKLGIVIDEVKTLSGEEMKGQLSDTTDIVSTLDLAPPSKQLMEWKKTGGSEKLFALSERTIRSSVLAAYYTRNLVTRRIEQEEDIPEEEELFNGNGDVDVPYRTPMATRRSERLAELEDLELEQMPPPASPSKAKKASKPRASQQSPAKKRRKHDKENVEDAPRTPRGPKTPRAADSERYSNNHVDEYEDSVQQFREGSTLPSFGAGNRLSAAQSERFAPDDDDFQDSHYDQPMSVGPPEEMMPDETAEQYEERMRNKRTTVLLRFMAEQLDAGGVAFSTLVKHNRRKQVAQKFFSLLVLKKQQAVELHQVTGVDYGEITISRGDRYEEAMTSSSL